jgi:hypothetical protein
VNGPASISTAQGAAEANAGTQDCGFARFPGHSMACVTAIKGIHIGELRRSDCCRVLIAWSSYAAATGPILASDLITARQKLDEAVNILLSRGVAYTGEVPATNGKIWAYQLQQIRDGVR